MRWCDEGSALRWPARHPCSGAQVGRVEISPEWDRHGKPLSFTKLKSETLRAGEGMLSHAFVDLVLLALR